MIFAAAYKKKITKNPGAVWRKRIKSELGLVVGAVTETRELMNHALARKGGAMNMCRALEELKQEGWEEGRKKGIEQGMVRGVE